MAFSLQNIAQELGWAHRVSDALRDYGSATGDPEIALTSVSQRSAAWLGLHEDIRYGPVPGRPLSYPAAYRLAMDLGELRAARLLELGDHADRLDRELQPSLHLLGFNGGIIGGIDGVNDPDGGLWDALGAWFEVGIGGLSDVLYRAAHDCTVISELPFRGLTFRRALGGLQAATRRLRGDQLADRLDALAIEIDANPEVVGDPASAMAEQVEHWLHGVVPDQGISELESARILAWAHKFRENRVPVDAQRIERFLAQFPGELRWVGEGLLDATEFYSQEQLGRSIAFVLKSYGLANLEDAALIHDAFRRELRGQGMRLPFRPPGEALQDAASQTLIFCGDAVITGAHPQVLLAQILDGLEPTQRATLANRQLVLVFAIGTLVGIETLGSWLEGRGLNPRILVGRELRWLSGLGLEELDAGTLYDADTGWLTQPGAQLADPLFSVHLPAWVGRDPSVAKQVCAEIGAALDPQAPSAWVVYRVDWRLRTGFPRAPSPASGSVVNGGTVPGNPSFRRGTHDIAAASRVRRFRCATRSSL